MWISYQKANILALEMLLSQSEGNDSGEVEAVEEDYFFLAEEADEEDA